MPTSPSPKSKEAGFANVLVLVAVFAAAGLIATSRIQTTKVFSTGPSQNVLGEDESKAEEQAKEVSQKAVEQQKEQQQQVAEQQKEVLKTQVQTQSEGSKQETEVETANGQKIKTKVEDNGVTKVEVEQGKLKLKYSVENGETKVEAENEASGEAKLSETEVKDAEDELENELEKEGVKIATGGGHLAIAKNKYAATTNFPLSVDVNTKQLIVTTPAGQKAVTVLPDQAIQNLLATGVISKIESQASDVILNKDLGNLDGVAKLEERDNEMVYKVEGMKNHKLLGIIPISVPTTAYVSAQSGNVIAQDQSLLANLLDLLSR